ncbi:MAG: hypothetical protein ACRC4N_04780, partial [Gammaproteobacteria bacterium]
IKDRLAILLINLFFGANSEQFSERVSERVIQSGKKAEKSAYLLALLEQRQHEQRSLPCSGGILEVARGPLHASVTPAAAPEQNFPLVSRAPRWLGNTCPPSDMFYMRLAHCVQCPKQMLFSVLALLMQRQCFLMGHAQALPISTLRARLVFFLSAEKRQSPFAQALLPLGMRL